MKKTILLVILLATSNLFAQVGIGTTAPATDAILDLTATNKALLLTRVANTSAIANPINGMLIYDISSNCIKGYENGAWTDCGFIPGPRPSSNGTGEVSAYSCSTASAGTMTVGEIVSGVTQTITAMVTTVGTYSISSTANGVTFAASGTFAATGAQNIMLTATGTPTAVGSTNFTLSTTPNCSFTRTTDAVVVPPPTNPIGLGSLSGKTCFDIALSNDNTKSCGPLSERLVNQSNFTNAATHTQSYTFTPSGTVSNVRFVYVNTNGTPIIAISGNNTANSISTPVVATVNYSTALNADALGLASASALTADIYVIYNDGATNNGTDRQIKLTANVKDCACCLVKISATVYKEFLCHNLGANTSLDPHVPVQAIHGDYYQWGRSTPAATTDAIIGSWNTSAAANGSWLDASKTVNDPCPAGYRVPTKTQWDGVIANNTRTITGSWANDGNFTSAVHFGPNATTKTLTLPAAGNRSSNDGSLFSRGNFSFYWSSTENSTNATNLFLGVTNTGTVNNSRTNGFSVRCIAE